MMICRLLAFGFLVILSVSDVKSRTIPAWPAGLLAAAGITLHVFLRDLFAAEVLAGALPGLFLLLLSWIFRSSIGTGDGTVTAACGLAVGFSAEVNSLGAALLLCSAFSLILLFRKNASRKDTLPFLPFLAAGHALILIMEAAA